MSDHQEKLFQLAKDVMLLSRNTLLVNLRFLDMALSQFELFPITESTLLTDGKIYAYLHQSIPDEKKLADIRGLFYGDNHEIWYMTAEEIEANFGLGAGDGGSDVGVNAAMAAVWQSISGRMPQAVKNARKPW